jgi:hypothetical protein
VVLRRSEAFLGGSEWFCIGSMGHTAACATAAVSFPAKTSALGRRCGGRGTLPSDHGRIDE